MADFQALCAELVDELSDFQLCVEETALVGWVSPDTHALITRARAALAESEPKGPTDDEVIEQAIAVGLAFQPRDDVQEVFLPFAADEDPLDDLLVAFARALLARWGRPTPAPDEGEVAELVEDLRQQANHGYCEFISGDDLRRAADLLERQAQQTLPQGLIPMEYVDADSSARIVSEPSEDGPGGCWVVINSRHVNPCTEFPTAEAAWDALQRAQSLPSTVGPFDRIKFTCHLVPREQADDRPPPL